MRSVYRYVGALVAGAATVGVTAGVVLGASHAAPTPVKHPTARPLRRHFAVLRVARGTAASNGAALPPGVAEETTGAGSESAGYALEPSGAQHVTLPSGANAWVIPGSNGVCLFVESSPSTHENGGTCGSVTNADGGMIFLVRSSDPTGVNGVTVGSKTIFGLVPDGSASVALTGGSASTTRLPVVSNVYEGTIGANAESLVVRDAQGTTTDIPLPKH
ncbi:MAG: hypothetical protein ACYDHN_08230 [Solirubrobacteraceae bacterium]